MLALDLLGMPFAGTMYLGGEMTADQLFFLYIDQNTRKVYTGRVLLRAITIFCPNDSITVIEVRAL